MRIVFVAMATSVHASRWISQVSNLGWDLHLFPSIDVGRVFPGLKSITVHHSVYGFQGDRDRSVTARGLPVGSHQLAIVGRALLKRAMPEYRQVQLSRLVRRLQPDIVHSLEIQAAGYLTLAARERHGGGFPAWIVTNWGSDIYLFGRLAEHKGKIRSVLGACDYYSCECQRDVLLARDLGFRGEVLPVLPNAGGLELDRVHGFRQAGPTSGRDLIVLKGHQHWAGRALVALRAIEMCAADLSGYRIAIYGASKDVRIAAELVSDSTGLNIEVLEPCSHDEMLRLFGRARLYIGLSISDAISTSLLDAIAMGAFPVQSCTACADEWIQDGVTGFIVPPEDPDLVSKAIRRAVRDDDLVNRAAELNTKVAKERLDYPVLQAQVVSMYEAIASARH